MRVGGADFKDPAILRTQYHEILEDGYNGLTTLAYGGMGWVDDDFPDDEGAFL